MPTNRKKSSTCTFPEKHHCPTKGCLYAIGSERHFSDKKFLNQHIAKVHAEKKFTCSKCQKGFGLDWWRRHHEETCGQEWHCDCGAKYFSRESLLTHARRAQHQLPDHILHTRKKKIACANAEIKEKPLIVIIQPVIQNLTCLQPLKNDKPSLVNLRPILPKISQPVILSLPVSPTTTPQELVLTSSTPVTPQTLDGFVFASPQSSEDNSTLHKDSNEFQAAKSPIKTDFNRNINKFQKAAVETQTSGEYEFLSSLKTLHSQASQCSRRAPKTIRIESTHTQTAESTVVKIKKKNLHSKSRRKSVAITTESNMLTNSSFELEQSLWPGIKDCIFQSSLAKISTCSTSTQTYSEMHNIVLCDSQTITDEDFLKFGWPDSRKQEKDIENSSSSFEILSEIAAEDSLTLPNVLETGNLPELGTFSTNSITQDAFAARNENQNSVNEFPVTSLESHLKLEACSMFPSVFNTSSESIPDKATPPTLLNTHTQTMASSVLDYNLLANMETQTTDDFSFSDLEFSDTETQTPWDDFPNIEDSPLPTDQLSIEIQTDFSSFNGDMNQDPYEFLNEMDMQNIIGGCSTKETTGINIETQTYDRLRFPQFTNSESQTLDMSQFEFG